MSRLATKILVTATTFAGLTLGPSLLAQSSGTPPAQNPPADKQPLQVAPLTLDGAAPPVNAQEDADIKAFRDAPNTDIPKKLQMGEDFVTKYPQSRYRVEVYGWQVWAYLSTGQTDKMLAAGKKELELEPNDPQTLAILGSVLPRSLSNTMTDEQKQAYLNDAETYSKKALEIIPTVAKPAGLTDEQFIAARNQTMSMAYSGLGLVAFRRGKFADAIPHLEQSVKLDPNPDPVNYFVLGLSNEKASHFDDAITAFTKCAAIQSSLQSTCTMEIDEAKKLSTSQLSVPK